MTARDAFIAERQTGIGGSDAGPILGVSKWASRMDVYLRLTGEVPATERDDEWLRWGQLLEPAILQRYSEVTGHAIERPALLRCEKHPFMIGHLDAVAPAAGRGVDAKNYRTKDGWGEPGTDEVPAYILAQVTHYMVISGLRVFDIAALFGGADFAIYTVPFDPELADMIVNAEDELWTCVQTRTPPPPQSLADVNALYRRSSGRRVEADSDAYIALSRLRTYREEIKALEAAEAHEELALKAFMADAESLVDAGGNVLATWKSSKPGTKIDLDELRQCHPAIVERFTRPAAPRRPFLLKKEKV